MELHFAPSVDQIVTMKSDFTSSFSCSDTVNGILTPTTPSTKSITADNPFYVPPPFQPFSYSHSPTGCYQVSPIEFSPSNKPTSYGSNYYVVNDEGNYYNNCGYSTVVDTPDSVFETEQDVNQFDYDDNYFKFDQDTVEKFMPQSDVLDLDSEYINYNEDNCNSKNQSPCSSPTDPWIMSSAMLGSHHNMGSNSPRIDNVQHFTQIQSLPSINQAFSTHFTGIDCIEVPAENINNHVNYSSDQNFLDSFDSTLFGDFAINEKSDSNEANDVQPNISHYINPENYNFVVTDEKPNREFKNIWVEEKLINAPMTAVEKIQNYQNFQNPQLKPKMQQNCSQEPDTSEQQLVCCWKNCNQEFDSQASLVQHIEKTHVCSTKGDEYTCLWTECPRQYRSFNARYKLLIHMRVHSGEKPNKCPVSVVNHNLHLSIFLCLFMTARKKKHFYSVMSSFSINLQHINHLLTSFCNFYCFFLFFLCYKTELDLLV